MCQYCDDPPAGFREHLGLVRDVIAAHGWAVQAVEGPRVPWAHTVGLTPRGMPEVLVSGLQPLHAVVVLNMAAGHAIGQGMPEAGVAFRMEGSPPAALIEVPERLASMLKVAIGLYGHGVRAVALMPEGASWAAIGADIARRTSLP